MTTPKFSLTIDHGPFSEKRLDSGKLSLASMHSEGTSSAETTAPQQPLQPPPPSAHSGTQAVLGGIGRPGGHLTVAPPPARNRRRSTIQRMSLDGTATGGLPGANGAGAAPGGPLRRNASRMFKAGNAPSSRRGSLQDDPQSANAKQHHAMTVTQQHPTSLPQEVLDLIQAFRVAVEHVAGNPSTPQETSKELHQTSNDLIRYVSSFLIMRYQEAEAEAERISSGWKNMALGITHDAKMNESAERMGPMAMQAIYGIIDALLNLCQCDRANLFLSDERTGELVSVVQVGAGSVMQPIRIKSKTGVVASVYGTGLAVNILSTERVPATLFDRTADSKTGYYTRSILAVPLVRPNGSENLKPANSATAKAAPGRTGSSATVGKTGDKQKGRATSQSPEALLQQIQASLDKQSGGSPAPSSVPRQRRETITSAPFDIMSDRMIGDGDEDEFGDGVDETNNVVENGHHAVTIGGSVIGVLQLINKAHHMNQGEFDGADEQVVHNAARLLTNIIQWTSLADLAGSSGLELSLKIQADLIAHREVPEGFRTNSTAGTKTVTITEANALFAKQKEKEKQLAEITMGKDLLSGRKGNTKKIVVPEKTSSNSNNQLKAPLGIQGVPRNDSSASPADAGPPTSVTELGRRVENGHTLIYRIGARPTREEQEQRQQRVKDLQARKAGAASGVENGGGLHGDSGASSIAPPQRDIRDVMLFLQQMEGSWKAAREKTQQQEDVIRQLRLHLFEERKRYRVLHTLCLKTGLILENETSTQAEADALLIPDEQVDDIEFLNRLNLNEERIRTQQKLVSTQDAFLQLEREKTASQGVRKSNEEQAAARRAKELAALRTRPFDRQLSKTTEREMDREHQHRKKVLLQKESGSVVNKTNRQAVEYRLEVEKQRRDTVKVRLAALVQQHNSERERLMDQQRQDTEDLYKAILLEDGQFEEALSRYLEEPNEGNPTPRLSYRAMVEELSTTNNSS